MIDNTLDRQFDIAAPDKAWVTDITYIRTNEGFAYLAVVIDLYSRRVIGWSMGPQFTSMDWAAFLKHHNLVHSMSRRGDCHDNAVAESFFNLFKRERIRRKVYRSRDEARQDVFDH